MIKNNNYDKPYYEALWYEGATEEEAMSGDFNSIEFRTRQAVLNYYNKNKANPERFNWWVTKRDADGFVIEDIIY